MHQYTCMNNLLVWHDIFLLIYIYIHSYPLAQQQSDFLFHLFCLTARQYLDLSISRAVLLSLCISLSLSVIPSISLSTAYPHLPCYSGLGMLTKTSRRHFLTCQRQTHDERHSPLFGWPGTCGLSSPSLIGYILPCDPLSFNRAIA